MNPGDRPGGNPKPGRQVKPAQHQVGQQETHCAIGAIEHGSRRGFANNCAVDLGSDHNCAQIGITPAGKRRPHDDATVVAEVRNRHQRTIVVDARIGRAGNLDAEADFIDNRPGFGVVMRDHAVPARRDMQQQFGLARRKPAGEDRHDRDFTRGGDSDAIGKYRPGQAISAKLGNLGRIDPADFPAGNRAAVEGNRRVLNPVCTSQVAGPFPRKRHQNLGRAARRYKGCRNGLGLLGQNDPHPKYQN